MPTCPAIRRAAVSFDHLLDIDHRLSPVSTPSRATFEQCALASRLLSQEQIDEAHALLRSADSEAGTPGGPPDDQQLAERLIAFGYLNTWQAQQLLQGRTKFTLGPYKIVDSLGQGGMGQVFKAEHQVMGRVVAIKVLPRHKSTPEAIANFTREIQALARLNHAKLVRALDAGRDGNVYYMVTEYVPGSDLRKLVRRSGPLDMEAAAAIISQVADGLQHAHERGIIHRDVKPGNVLVTPDGEAKLLDLGLAGPMGGNVENDPRFGKIVGTADYLSPDHIQSPREPTPAWDVYSLGCTLYYAVTGKVPFPGGNTADKARAHCELRPLDPRRLNHKLCDSFVDVIADMMAKDPAERVPSAAAVIERLAPWACGAPTGAPSLPPGPWDPGWVATSGPIHAAASVESATPEWVLPTSDVPTLPQAPPLPSAARGPAPLPPVVAPRAATAPVVPPPVVREPVALPPYFSQSSPPLRDTVSDFPFLNETEPDSEESPSLIVDTRRRWLLPLIISVGLPVVLMLIALVIWLLSTAKG
jgi:serine/threonine protein kinase